MKNFLFFSIIIFALAPSFVFSQEIQKKKALFFTGPDCLHCQNVEKYFQQNGIYEKYEIKKMDVSEKENLESLDEFLNVFEIKAEKRGLPAIFFDNNLIVGDQPILRDFTKSIDESQADSFPDPNSLKNSLIARNIDMENDNQKEIEISFWVLFLAAILGAVNPCTFLVIIFIFWALIFYRGGKPKIKLVLSFFGSIFGTHLILGFILYKLIGFFSFPEIFSMLAGIISFVLGLLGLKNFLRNKKFFSERHFRMFLNSVDDFYIFLDKKTSHLLGSVLAGSAIALVLLPSSGWPYEIIFGTMAEKMDTFQAYSYLFFYNIAFFIPIIIFSVVFYYIANSKKSEFFLNKDNQLLQTIYGAIMLFIGAYLIVNYFI